MDANKSWWVPWLCSDASGNDVMDGTTLEGEPFSLITEQQEQQWHARGITLRNGIWPQELRERSASSYKELATILLAIRQAGGQKPSPLSGKVLYHFTDNSNAVDCLAKGSSKSEALLKLVRLIQHEEAVQDFTLCAIHAAGDHLVYNGVDGISRGRFEGAFAAGASGSGPAIPVHRPRPVPEPIRQYIREVLGVGQDPTPISGWEQARVRGKHTLYAPPASVVRQCFYWANRSHSLDPHHTGFTIVAPWVRPNNYGTMSKYADFVQVFEQGTFGIPATDAVPWIVLHRLPSPVPLAHGYLCGEQDTPRPRTAHPTAAVAGWSRWRDHGRDPAAVAWAHQDMRRTMKEKPRRGGYAAQLPRPPPGPLRSHTARHHATITDDEVRMVMGSAGRMLHGLGDASQPGRGIRKLQAFWWLRRQRKLAAAALAARLPSLSAADALAWGRCTRKCLSTAHKFILNLRAAPALLWWNYPAALHTNLVEGWRDPRHHEPEENYQGNYPSVAAESVRRSLRETWLGDYIRVEPRARCLNPMGAVPKDIAADVWRPVLDVTASLVNRAVDMTRGAQPLLPDLLARVYPDCWLTKADYQRGYQHAKMHVDTQPDYGVLDAFTGEVGVYTAYPFGGARSGEVFCNIVRENEEALARTAPFSGTLIDNTIESGCHDPDLPAVYRRRAGGRVACTIDHFVDDGHQTAPTEAAALEAVQQMLRTFRDQGVQLDLKKYVPPAQHGVPFLACEVDTRASSGGPLIRVKQRTRAKVLETITDFTSQHAPRGRAPRRKVAALLGQLVGISPAVPSGAANLQSMHRVASGAHFGLSYGLQYDRDIALPAIWWRELDWWHRLLSMDAYKGVTSRRHGSASTVYQFSDASGDAWGFARLAPEQSRAAATRAPTP